MRQRASHRGVGQEADNRCREKAKGQNISPPDSDDEERQKQKQACYSRNARENPDFPLGQFAR